jgi:hypothetical protein
VPGYPPSVSPRVENNPKLNALMAIVASDRNRVSALNYLYDHPLFVSPNAIPGLQLGARPPLTRETLALANGRPECPMPVARSVVKNDSMPVRRLSTGTTEAMPVSPSRCVNPLNVKP